MCGNAVASLLRIHPVFERGSFCLADNYFFTGSANIHFELSVEKRANGGDCGIVENELTIGTEKLMWIQL